MIEYGLKNFRKFDGKGCNLALAPITFFTGCNNSGKSSVSKSLVLLSQMYKRIHSSFREYGETIPLEELYLDLSDKSLGMGDYASILNNKANKDDGVWFSFSSYSHYLCRTVIINLCFRQCETEVFNRISISEFTVYNQENQLIVSGKADGKLMTYFIEDEPSVEPWFYKQALRIIFKEISEFLPKEVAKKYKKAFSGLDAGFTWDHDLMAIISSCRSEYLVCNEIPSEKDFFIQIADSFYHLIDPLPDEEVSINEFRRESSYTLECFANRHAEHVFLSNCIAALGHRVRTQVDDDRDTTIRFRSFIFDLFFKYVLREVLLQDYEGGSHPPYHLVDNYLNLDGIRYIGTTSVSLKRLYSESDSTDLIARLIPQVKSDFSFTNKWIRKLRIGNSLIIKTAPEGTGYFIYVHSNWGGYPSSRLLADCGYGVSQLIVLLLLVDAWREKKTFYDYGWQYTLIIEEPEVHLHPSFQARLAEIFLDAFKSYSLRFIVETHSEYILRKSQVIVSKMGFRSNEIADSNSPFRAYYFPNKGQPYSLGYRRDGYFTNSFGKGFYDESSSLTFELL